MWLEWAAASAILGLVLSTGLGCSKTAKQARHTARADEYGKKQQYAKAEVEYLNALRYSPNDTNLAKKLAYVLCEQGRNFSAVSLLNNLKQIAPNDIEVRSKLAENLYHLLSFPLARQESLFVVTNQPTNGAVLLILVETSIGLTQLVESSNILQRLGQQAPSPAFHIANASLQGRLGNLTAAEDHLKRATTAGPSSPALDLAWAKLRFAQTNIIEGEALLKRAADASPFNSIMRLHFIDFHLGRGEISTARPYLVEITEKIPDYVPAWVRLANIALIEKRFQDCDELTKKATRLDSRNYEALLLRAQMWAAQRKFESAREELERVDSMLPNNPAVMFELARNFALTGEQGRALALVTEALKLNPRFAPATLLQAELNLRSGNSDIAIASLRELLKIRPESREAAALLGTTYLSRRRTDEALATFRDMTQRFTNDPTSWNSVGAVLLGKGDRIGARQAFEHALRISPASIAAVDQLVNLDITVTNFPAAFARARSLHSVLTNSAVPYALEARIHEAANDLKAAEAALLKGAEIDPNATIIAGSLARIYVRSGDYNKAIKRLDEITKRTTNAIAWTDKGILYENNLQPDQAIACYERAISINKNFALALNNLAYLTAKNSKRLSEAQDLAARAVQNAPESPETADTLGWIMFQRRDFVGARRIFNDITEKTNHPEILYHAAMTDYAIGDEQRARARFAKALENPALPVELQKDATNRIAILDINLATPSAADIQRLETAIKADENDYLAHFRFGTIHQIKGSHEKAIAEFEAAAKSNPQSAQPHLALARLQAAANVQAALKEAREARKLAPDDANIAVTLGALSVRTHDYVAGYALLQEAQGGGTLTRAADIYEFAVAQFAAGRISDATATLNSIGATAPSNIQQSAREAITLISGASDQKAALAETRLKASGSDILGLVAAAEAAERKNNARKAVELYTKALSVAPNFTPAHQRLALLYIDALADDKSAYTHALKAREAAPNDAQTARVLGKIALQRKNYADALRFAQEASTGLNDGEPYYLIGAANLNLKRTNDAKVALNKATTLPLKPEIAAATKRLLSEIK